MVDVKFLFGWRSDVFDLFRANGSSRLSPVVRLRCGHQGISEWGSSFQWCSTEEDSTWTIAKAKTTTRTNDCDNWLKSNEDKDVETLAKQSFHIYLVVLAKSQKKLSLGNAAFWTNLFHGERLLIVKRVLVTATVANKVKEVSLMYMEHRSSTLVDISSTPAYIHYNPDSFNLQILQKFCRHYKYSSANCGEVEPCKPELLRS